MSSLPASVANQDSTPRCAKTACSPPEEFSASSHQSLEEYEALYKQSIEDPEKFWAVRRRPICTGSSVGQGSGVESAVGQVVVGGKLNLSYNCVDRHALGERRNKTCIIWEGEPGEVRRLTYAELHAEVQKFANALKSLGIQKGDRVAVYMGMTPELASRCWPARASAPCTPSSSADLPPTPLPTAWPTRMRGHPDQDTSYRRGGEIKLKALSTKPCRVPHSEACRRLQAHGHAR